MFSESPKASNAYMDLDTEEKKEFVFYPLTLTHSLLFAHLHPRSIVEIVKLPREGVLFDEGEIVMESPVSSTTSLHRDLRRH